MSPGGETDLARMLASLDPVVRAGEFAYVLLPGPPSVPVDALVVEEEGVTVVVPRETADANDWPYDFVAAWITLRVHSDLSAVGLTAAFSTALAARGVPCNVLAGTHHDHLLVPLDRVDDALAALATLAARSAG